MSRDCVTMRHVVEPTKIKLKLTLARARDFPLMSYSARAAETFTAEALMQRKGDVVGDRLRHEIMRHVQPSLDAAAFLAPCLPHVVAAAGVDGNSKLAGIVLRVNQLKELGFVK